MESHKEIDQQQKEQFEVKICVSNELMNTLNDKEVIYNQASAQTSSSNEEPVKQAPKSPVLSNSPTLQNQPKQSYFIEISTIGADLDTKEEQFGGLEINNFENDDLLLNENASTKTEHSSNLKQKSESEENDDEESSSKNSRSSYLNERREETNNQNKIFSNNRNNNNTNNHNNNKRPYHNQNSYNNRQPRNNNGVMNGNGLLPLPDQNNFNNKPQAMIQNQSMMMMMNTRPQQKQINPNPLPQMLPLGHHHQQQLQQQSLIAQQPNFNPHLNQNQPPQMFNNQIKPNFPLPQQQPPSQMFNNMVPPQQTHFGNQFGHNSQIQQPQFAPQMNNFNTRPQQPMMMMQNQQFQQQPILQQQNNFATFNNNNNPPLPVNPQYNPHFNQQAHPRFQTPMVHPSSSALPIVTPSNIVPSISLPGGHIIPKQPQPIMMHNHSHHNMPMNGPSMTQPAVNAAVLPPVKLSHVFLNPSFIAKQQQQQSNGNTSIPPESSSTSNPVKPVRSRVDLNLLLEQRLAEELSSEENQDLIKKPSSSSNLKRKSEDNHYNEISSKNRSRSKDNKNRSRSPKSDENRQKNGNSINSLKKYHSDQPPLKKQNIDRNDRSIKQESKKEEPKINKNSSLPPVAKTETRTVVAEPARVVVVDDPHYYKKLEEQKRKREEIIKLKEQKRNQRVLEMKKSETNNNSSNQNAIKKDQKLDDEILNSNKKTTFGSRTVVKTSDISIKNFKDKVILTI
jgi:hypothetical protein